MPNAFRLAVTTPILKRGDRKTVSNYRPVAQLSIMCIIMEKCIADYLTSFLNLSAQSDPHQHGFCRGKSTETQLLEVLQDWGMSLSRKHPIHVT